jgi:hypothetical protein
VQYAPWPNLLAHKTSHSRDLQRLISVRQPVNELMRCLSTTVGDVGRWDGFVEGSKEDSGDAASKVVA